MLVEFALQCPEVLLPGRKKAAVSQLAAGVRSVFWHVLLGALQGLERAHFISLCHNRGTNRDFLLWSLFFLLFIWTWYLGGPSFKFQLKICNSSQQLQEATVHMVWPHKEKDPGVLGGMAAEPFCGRCHFHRSDLREESSLKGKRWLPCDALCSCQWCFTLRQSATHVKGLVCTWCCLRKPESLHPHSPWLHYVYSLVVWWLGKSSSTREDKSVFFLKT